jgi:hypothetical protein
MQDCADTTLPTAPGNYGASFFVCLRQCMERNNCENY